MNSTIVPEVINDYNVYNTNSDVLVGISGEIPLPNFAALTATMSGAGIGGEIEDPVIGKFKSTEMEIPFRSLYSSQFELMDTNQPLALTIRGAEQGTDKITSASVMTQVRIVIRGKFKEFEGGKMKSGESTDSKVKLELWYILIEIGGKKMLELDKFNSVYVVNGKDMLADVNKYC